MTTTFISRNYDRALVARRYVRAPIATEQGYLWQEVNKDRYTMREGRCWGYELPTEVMHKADSQQGLSFSFVEWPIEK